MEMTKDTRDEALGAGERSLREAVSRLAQCPDAERQGCWTAAVDAVNKYVMAVVCIRADIAVLEAERDELLVAEGAGFSNVADAQAERDALRERAQALGAKVGAQREHMREMKTYQLETATRAEKAESRLAAIRQRAGDFEALVAAWNRDLQSANAHGVVHTMEAGCSAVARYILGPGATEVAQEPETAADRARKFDEALGGKRFVSAIDEAEPTTAEAFATVRGMLESGRDEASCAGEKPWRDALAALSLLERHVRRMERAIRLRLEATTVEEAKTAHNAMRAVLTDAPAVRGGGGSPVTHEPTTAEAFATVRKWCDDFDEGGEAVQMLSLLERRLGAMAGVLGALLAYDANGRNFGLTRIIDMARAALTDAPNRRTS